MVRFLAFLQLVVLPCAFAEGWYISAGMEPPIRFHNGVEQNFNVTASPRGDRGGYSALDNNRPGYHLAVGKQMGNFRVEGRVFWIAYDINTVEYTYTDPKKILVQDLNGYVDLTGETELRGLELNIYYDFINKTKWVPYIGVGLGEADMENSLEGVAITEEHLSFAYQYKQTTFHIRGGVAYELSPRAKLDLGYTLRRLGDDQVFQEADENSRLEFEGHDNSYLSLGIRFRVGGRRQ
ncbi:MAG: outer membrane beta-barrel protein [Bacteriovoracales bacterium]|nr:outer membrane beta-barrel protein [Bacteriovoracales bacterium]